MDMIKMSHMHNIRIENIFILESCSSKVHVIYVLEYKMFLPTFGVINEEHMFLETNDEVTHFVQKLNGS